MIVQGNNNTNIENAILDRIAHVVKINANE